MPHFSAGTIILLIIAALLLFGPSRLPELGRAFGRTLREFKSGARDIMESDEAKSPVRADPVAIRAEVENAAEPGKLSER